MKIFSASLLLVFTTLLVQSQTQPSKVSHYIFPDFIKGTVKFKSGVKYETMINYNTYLEEMVVSQSGNSFVVLGELENIDTVNIANRKFIPSGKVFFEILTDIPVPAFIHYTCKSLPPVQHVGFGGTSQTTNTSASTVKQDVGFYNIRLPESYNLKPQETLLIKKDGKYVRIGYHKHLEELYPLKKDAIRKFVKENKTDFNRADEVKKLLIHIL